MLAYSTAFNILPYKLHKTRPPELGSDKLVGLEITGVASSLVIMAVGEDGAMEGFLQGNVDTAFVSEDVVIILPVGEIGPEGSGDVLQG